MGWLERFRKGLEGEQIEQIIIENEVDLSVEPYVSRHRFIACQFRPEQIFGDHNMFDECYLGVGSYFGSKNLFMKCKVGSPTLTEKEGKNTFDAFNIFYRFDAKAGNTFGDYCEFTYCEFGDRNKFGSYSKFSPETAFGANCKFGNNITLLFPIKVGNGAVFGRNCKIILSKYSSLGTYTGSPKIIRV